MKVAVVGTGYVGLVAGTCLADAGHKVLCVDKDERKIAGLKRGEIPIYEPGLSDLVLRNSREGRLSFTDDLPAAVASAEVVYICVGTPPDAQGRADLSAVFAVAQAIGKALKSWTVVVMKSTVPVGTADKVKAILKEVATAGFEVVSNPEFLKEGAAIVDFNGPDRVVVGTADGRARDVMRSIYEPFLRTGKPIMFMDNRSAEFTKYAANCLLATKISFMNEMANLAERVGADIDHVRKGIAADVRIGPHFLFPGAGYGGSCFPKDVEALVHTAEEAGFPMKIMSAVSEVNQAQKAVLFSKIQGRYGSDLKGKRFAVWGLAFKPKTDDMREAPSVVLINALLEAGAEVVAYDPEAGENARVIFGDRVRVVHKDSDCLDGATALIIVTEWKQFRRPDFVAIKAGLKEPVIFDGRNLFDPDEMKSLGFIYYGIGRLQPKA